MSCLASSLDRLEPRYDVVVVGSGYGGGVAASRLARAGKRVAVLERGREFVTGEFPSRFPDLRGEMQLAGRRLRLGSPTGLYDVRFGEDMHVLIGCGLGGGSLINAGVALRPDPRVFADPVWPAEVAGDGLLDEGYARAVRWVRPARDDAAAGRTKYQALATAGAALGKAPVPAPVVVSFAATVNPAGVAQPACTRCGDCCGGCNVGAKNTVALTYLPDAARHGAEIFTHAKVRHVAKAPDGGWCVHFERLDGGGADGAAKPGTVTADMVVLAAGTLGSTEILLRSRERGLALSDRLGKSFSANGDIIAFGYGAKLPVNAIGVGASAQGRGPGRRRLRLRPDRDRRRAVDLANSLTIQEGVLPSALAPILPALFIPNGRLLGALKSLIAGVYKGPFASLQTFFARIARHGLGAPRARGRPDRARLAGRQGRAGLPAPRRGAGGAGAAGRRQLRQEPAGRHHDGPAAGDRASARRLRHGTRARRRRRQPQVPGVRCRSRRRRGRRARRALRDRRGDHAAVARRQPAAHHHRAGRARHAAPGARPRPGVRRRAAQPTQRRFPSPRRVRA